MNRIRHPTPIIRKTIVITTRITRSSNSKILTVSRTKAIIIRTSEADTNRTPTPIASSRIPISRLRILISKTADIHTISRTFLSRAII